MKIGELPLSQGEKKILYQEWKRHIKQIPVWYELYPELAEEAYGKNWKSVLFKAGCEIKGW